MVSVRMNDLVVCWVVVVTLRIERIKRVTVIAAEWQAFFDALG
jgi:hypothetical protein